MRKIKDHIYVNYLILLRAIESELGHPPIDSIEKNS